MVLLTALLGAPALVQMSRIHANAEEIATNLLPSVTQTGELRVLLNRMRRAEAGMVGARSAAEVKAFAEQVAARHKDLSRVEAVYEPLIDSPRNARYSTPTRPARRPMWPCRTSWRTLPKA